MPTVTGINSGQVRVAGTGAIWRAPAGTVLPVDSVTAWGTGFVNLGYGLDGFTAKPNYKTKAVRGWQSKGVLRNIATEVDWVFDFELMQSNVATLAMAWGNAVITPGTLGVYTMALGDPSAEFILGIDWSDGVLNQRMVLSRVSLAALPTIKFVRTDAVSYIFSVQTLVPVDGSDQVKILGVDAAVAGP